MPNWKVRQAVLALNSGGVIAYPTEAIYGLGCDPWNEAAAIQLLTMKQRSWAKGLIVIAADFNQLQDFIKPVEPEVLKQLEATWPGPTTWLLPAVAGIPIYLCGEHDTVAVRVTAHQQTAELCHAFGGAIVSTSANITGMRPARSIREVHWQLPNVDYALSGQCTGADMPTNIKHALTGEILR